MRILVTGATSFIGRNLVAELTGNGHDVTAVVRKKSSKAEFLKKNKNISIIEANMDEYYTISNMCNTDIDAVVHLSWDGTSISDRDNEFIQKENFENSVCLLKEVIKLNCKKFIFIGSQFEYGVCNDEITEETACIPVIWYGREKLHFCRYAMKYCDENKISFIETRIFSVYGYGDNENKLINSLISKMYNNETCNLTLGIQKWDYLYIKDAVCAIRLLLEKKCSDGIYNLGSGDTRTLKSFIEEIKSCLNSKSELNYGAIPYPKSGMETFVPNIKKIQHEIGWKAEIPFSQGIQYIISQKLKNGD